MKKLIYALIFVIAFGTSYLLLPYFRNIDNPRLRYVYAITDASTSHISIPSDATYYYDAENGINYRIIRASSLDDTTIFTKVMGGIGSATVVGYEFVAGRDYILASDISFLGKALRSTTVGLAVGRVFNGNGYKITNAAITGGNGIFTVNKGKIKNLVIDATCTASGSVITANNEGLIESVVNNANVTASTTASSVNGGLAALNSGTIRDCVNHGDTTGQGGIVGFNLAEGKIENSINNGVVGTSRLYAGGIAGRNEGTITGCENYGDVSGKAPYAGGIAGISIGTVSASENNASVIGESAAGGIAGVFKGLIQDSNNYRLVKATGTSGIAGGIAGRTDSGATAENTTISGCKNNAVVIGNTSNGILGNKSDDKATITDTKNYGRLNGKTELTLKIDAVLAQFKVIILGVVGALLIFAFISMIVDRVKIINNRRREIESVLYGAQ
ncbi:MAG: hypothetical protein LBT30_01120 [Clostridiales bacterium]|jgi:hypothetical protein|nr:hypothetical protein [Clostridiales bacterium]